MLMIALIQYTEDTERMKLIANKNEIKLIHSLLSIVLDDAESLTAIIEANSLCFDMSQQTTEHTIKTLDRKIAQQLKSDLLAA